MVNAIVADNIVTTAWVFLSTLQAIAVNIISINGNAIPGCIEAMRSICGKLAIGYLRVEPTNMCAALIPSL
jgi:hypothetical protein